ncbi:uncharacterized protein LAESUDRAFT_763863 [Laetiporus sulphureus 93-53]|uniref:Uncharacterized protein n=1 Tax=Laetiporus sulphureus 93-53 TaxID=1314785 RepID=A0A165BL86_9APHY|nr:uncharacterized protein LAESUDRAFT_763863 [Laetiporus sulphureus 93-53]KZT01259.1 hypothetical protein LAESUDRAFT_763863 [Laetiporus sulphureus 93-53]
MRREKFQKVKTRSQVRATQALAKERRQEQSDLPDVDILNSSVSSATLSLSDKNSETVIETASEPAPSMDRLYSEILISEREDETDEYEPSAYDDAMDMARNEDSILHDLSAILPSHFSITREIEQTLPKTPQQDMLQHLETQRNTWEEEEAEEEEEVGTEVVAEVQDREVMQEKDLADRANWVADPDQEEAEVEDQVEVAMVADQDQMEEEEEDRGQGKHPEEEELWLTVPVTSTADYALFKQQIFELYPGAEGDHLYTIADLEQCIVEALT